MHDCMFFRKSILIYASVFICITVGVYGCDHYTLISHADGD